MIGGGDRWWTGFQYGGESTEDGAQGCYEQCKDNEVVGEAARHQLLPSGSVSGRSGIWPAASRAARRVAAAVCR